MFGHVRRWVIVGAAFGSFAGGVLASSGIGRAGEQWNPGAYLTKVGPVPLRFLSAEPPATNFVRMPLPAPKPPPAVTPAASEDATPKKAAPPTPPAAAPQAASPPAPAEPTVAPPAADPMISPQMLMKFFNHSTNGSSSGILAPMDFAPPSSAKPASGSATYSTNPN